jgi:glucose 1-dehydrogenase
MTDRLKDKVALITGSDSGMGQATAIAFAEEGADVAITHLHDQQGAEETRKQVESAGRRAAVFHFDQREPSEVDNLFRQVEEKLGTPYILVNNAGIDSTGKQVSDMSTDEWNEELQTNISGPFYCCQHFIRKRREAGGKGKIINITSVHQEIPRTGSAGYAVAKGGLRNLTRTLCLELAPDHINVNNIAPGMVLTPFNQQAIDDPKVREQQVQSIPWKRAAEPWEIGRLAVYLAPEDADYVTGQDLHN